MVTRDTPWLPGTPSWVDVTVDDVPKAIAFYQALFGWDIEGAVFSVITTPAPATLR